MTAVPRTVRINNPVPGLDEDPDDFVGYELLVDFIRRRALPDLGGDIVEIGAYKGRGTAKLASLAQEYGRTVYAVDLFDPTKDTTISHSGVSACEVYEAFLNGRSMLDAYLESTGGFRNIVTIRDDSTRVVFAQNQQFFFGFIDGCHQEAYVEHDFRLIWPHLVSGGVLGLHDYRYHDWPEVTRAARKLMRQFAEEIAEAYEIEGKYGILSLLLVKR